MTSHAPQTETHVYPENLEATSKLLPSTIKSAAPLPPSLSASPSSNATISPANDGGDVADGDRFQKMRSKAVVDAPPTASAAASTKVSNNNSFTNNKVKHVSFGGAANAPDYVASSEPSHHHDGPAGLDVASATEISAKESKERTKQEKKEEKSRMKEEKIVKAAYAKVMKIEKEAEAQRDKDEIEAIKYPEAFAKKQQKLAEKEAKVAAKKAKEEEEKLKKQKKKEGKHALALSSVDEHGRSASNSVIEPDGDGKLKKKDSFIARLFSTKADKDGGHHDEHIRSFDRDLAERDIAAVGAGDIAGAYVFAGSDRQTKTNKAKVTDSTNEDHDSDADDDEDGASTVNGDLDEESKKAFMAGLTDTTKSDKKFTKALKKQYKKDLKEKKLRQSRAESIPAPPYVFYASSNVPSGKDASQSNGSEESKNTSVGPNSRDLSFNNNESNLSEGKFASNSLSRNAGKDKDEKKRSSSKNKKKTVGQGGADALPLPPKYIARPDDKVLMLQPMAFAPSPSSASVNRRVTRPLGKDDKGKTAFNKNKGLKINEGNKSNTIDKSDHIVSAPRRTNAKSTTEKDLCVVRGSLAAAANGGKVPSYASSLDASAEQSQPEDQTLSRGDESIDGGDNINNIPNDSSKFSIPADVKEAAPSGFNFNRRRSNKRRDEIYRLNGAEPPRSAALKARGAIDKRRSTSASAAPKNIKSRSVQQPLSAALYHDYYKAPAYIRDVEEKSVAYQPSSFTSNEKALEKQRNKDLPSKWETDEERIGREQYVNTQKLRRQTFLDETEGRQRLLAKYYDGAAKVLQDAEAKHRRDDILMSEEHEWKSSIITAKDFTKKDVKEAKKAQKEMEKEERKHIKEEKDGEKTDASRDRELVGASAGASNDDVSVHQHANNDDAGAANSSSNENDKKKKSSIWNTLTCKGSTCKHDSKKADRGATREEQSDQNTVTSPNAVDSNGSKKKKNNNAGKKEKK